MNITDYKKTTEYLNALEQLTEWAKHAEQSEDKKLALLNILQKLQENSIALGKNNTAVRLYNLAGGHKEAGYYMPTAQAKIEKCDSTNKLIVMITHELSRTGAPVVFMDAAKLLVAAGYQVIMLSPMDGPLREDICDAGIPVIVDHNLLYGRCEQEELREVHQYQKWVSDIFVSFADLVIANTAVVHNVVERYMKQDVSIIWWLHEGNVSFEAFGDCLPKVLTDNVKVVYVSDYVREQMEASGIFYPGEVMHYGVDDLVVNDSAKNGTTDEIVKFVIVGAVSERKGQDLLLSAINRLPFEYLKKSIFYFVGSPADINLYNRIEMLSNGSEYINLYKAMPRDELIDFYRECDCIICSSRDDPLPVVLTEMMILSKPCICSKHTGTAAYMEDGKQGYLFENENVDELVQKICQCIHNPDKLIIMGQNARALYEEQFTMAVFENKLLELVKKRLRNKGF